MKKRVLFSFLFFLVTIYFVSAQENFVLVIDPGHGGRDAGAVRGDYKEKDLNLGVALALGRLVESNLKGVKVIYTRKNDKFVDLYKRAEIANKAKANLFISIHTNSTASRTTSAQGADTYILGLARSEENLAVAKRENSVILLEDNYNKRYEGFDPNSPESYIIFEFMTDKYMKQSLEFAGFVQRGFTNIAKRKDRGVRQASFLVLRETAMPSVLIELGFINNPSEAKYLSASTGQRSVASAIYTGVKKYVEDFNKHQGQALSRIEDVRSRNRNVESPSQIVDDYKVRTEPPDRVQSMQSNPESDQSVSSISREIGIIPFISKKKDVNELNDTSRLVEIDSYQQLEPVSAEVEVSVPIVSSMSVDEVSVAVKNAIEPRKEENNQPKGKDILDVVEYRVQILISQRKLPATSIQFKGLSPVSEYKDGKVFKYTYGSTSDEAEALRIKSKIQNKFKDAFVVKFKNGERIK